MYNCKLFKIVTVIIALLVLAGCSNQLSEIYANAEEGIIDLTRLQLNDEIALLNGEWEFYWNQLLESGETDAGHITGYITIPSSWNNYETKEETIKGDGYATYKMTIITNKNERLALKIPRLHTSYRLWVNGELSAQAGIVGINRDTMTPQYLPQVAFFDSQEGPNEIIIQVSNFYHRSGGILESIKLGGEKQILGLQYRSIAYNILLFGSLMFMGLYHLVLFLYRKKNISALYFGSFCVLIAVRTLLVGESFLIYLNPAFSWEIAHKIMTLTYYLGLPLIAMFFLSIFPAYFHVSIVKLAKIMGAVFGLLIILTPARIFTVVNPVYQIWSVIVIIYIFVVLLKIFSHKEKDSWLIVLGASALLFTTLNDIVFNNIWMNDNEFSILRSLFKTGNLSSVGQLIFASANALLLAKKFSNSLEQEEIITAELTEINTNLDTIVLQRTVALVESNEKIEQQKLELEKANQQLQKLTLKDSLTDLWNRRKYDETINLEWSRCLRYQRPIALILIDIDCFKEYNDCYGHLTGDECLAKVGQSIKNSLQRATDMAARYGGEEFILVMPEMEKKGAIAVANGLRQKIEALHIPHESSPVSSHVTVSIGVTCTIPNMNSSHDDLFKAVDKALYQAKADGRNRVDFFTL